jgi:hypothetical protein
VIVPTPRDACPVPLGFGVAGEGSFNVAVSAGAAELDGHPRQFAFDGALEEQRDADIDDRPTRLCSATRSMDPPGGGPDTTTRRWLDAPWFERCDVRDASPIRSDELLDVTVGDYRTVASITRNSEETLRRWYDAGPNMAKKMAVLSRAEHSG